MNAKRATPHARGRAETRQSDRSPAPPRKYRISGHESFPCRYAWLPKAVKGVLKNPPLVKRKDGKYEGSILGFVRGLRLSARLIYFLREHLSSTDLEVDWGHLLQRNETCSPECDVVVHTKGHAREWNGSNNPIMSFKFIDAESVRAVVSCKSSVSSIDKAYPKTLKKYGVDHVFLFAECCHESKFPRLREAATRAGYRGLWCLYLTQRGGSIKDDPSMHAAFAEAVARAVRK
jgi:hypothetical protein